MKKLYFLVVFGVFAAMAAIAQYSTPISQQPIQLQRMQISEPLKGNSITSVQPISPEAPGFLFDSLNVSYQGSWGFGQSFSISSASTRNIVFVGSGAGVYILGVTDPSSPLTLSQISTRGLVDASYFDEATDRLYLTSYFAGFEIWDVSNMEAPVKIGGGSVNGLPRGGIFASGNLVYVVTVVDGVQIYDVTNPSSPSYVSTCSLDPNNLAWNSAKSGDLIFVAQGDGGLTVVDVSDPSNPFIAGTYNTQATGVWIANGYAYVADYNIGLHILDYSNLLSIAEVGLCPVIGFPYRVQVAGNYAYLANATSNPGGGINVIDVTDASNPQLLTTYAGYAERVAVAGSALAFTGMTLPCTILDVFDPSSPTLANSFKLPIMVSDIAVSGNYAYTGDNGFRVFDISDKANPVQVGYDTLDGAIVRLAGNTAVYIRESMTSNNPVMIMDVTDPAQPAFLGQYMAPVMTNDLEIKDHYAFVACWWDGFRVVDFQDPANPVLAAHKMYWFQNAVPGVDYCYVQALDIEGNYLYLIDYEPFSNEDTRGLYIWDITDPVSPVFVSRFTDFQSSGYDIDAVGNFVYIADMYGGLEAIDVSNKVTPVKRGYIALPDVANSVCVKSNHAVVADYINGGVQVVNVNDPDNPVVDGYYAPSGCFALGVTVDGSDIYLADGAGGFQIYNSTLVTGISDEARKNGISGFAYPSPFSNHVSIKVEIKGDPQARLAIYDASGRLVVTLNPGQVSSGSLTYEWDGRSASGKEVNAGFYYYKTLSGSVSGKMVKVH